MYVCMYVCSKYGRVKTKLDVLGPLDFEVHVCLSMKLENCRIMPSLSVVERKIMAPN